MRKKFPLYGIQAYADGGLDEAKAALIAAVQNSKFALPYFDQSHLDGSVSPVGREPYSAMIPVLSDPVQQDYVYTHPADIEISSREPFTCNIDLTSDRPAGTPILEFLIGRTPNGEHQVVQATVSWPEYDITPQKGSSSPIKGAPGSSATPTWVPWAIGAGALVLFVVGIIVASKGAKK